MTIPQDLADRLERVLIDVLKAYEQWEADIVLERACWHDGLPSLTQPLFDRMLEIQEMRNIALKHAYLRRSAPASGEMREAVLAEREACAHLAEQCFKPSQIDNELLTIIARSIGRTTGVENYQQRALDVLSSIHSNNLSVPQPSKTAPADQSDAGRDGVIEVLRELIAEHDKPIVPLNMKDHPFGVTMKIPSDEQIASMELWARARALASAPSETVGRGEDDGHLRKELKSVLMRLDNIAYANPNNYLSVIGPAGAWIRKNREALLDALALPTADRDAIREALKEAKFIIKENMGAVHIPQSTYAALALLGEG